jgi:hypothetical protein
MTVFRASKVSALIASAAAISHSDNAAAQFAPAAPGTMTYSFEGGFSVSNLSTTNFPGGAVPFIPQDFDKVGSNLQSSGGPNQGWRTGGYGSFSVARNFDAINDWRFSAAFYVFGSKNGSASASQDFSNPSIGFFATNSAAVTERDRFGIYTADFDFGRNFSAGVFQVRAFSGLRGVYIKDGFDSSIHTDSAGSDKLGLPPLITDTFSRGRASFYGTGPRVGVEVFTGSVFGVVGNLSGAVMGGYREANVLTTNSVAFDGGAPFLTATQLTNNEFSWVANISGSLGLAWQFAPNGQLVIGYKLDQWWNVRSNFSFAGLDRKEDVLIQTPFIKATLRF